MYFIEWLKLWLRQQMSKRGVDGHFVGWPGSVKVFGKKFFTIKNSIERKKVFARNPKGPTLTVRRGKLSLTKPKFMTMINPTSGQRANVRIPRRPGAVAVGLFNIIAL